MAAALCGGRDGRQHSQGGDGSHDGVQAAAARCQRGVGKMGQGGKRRAEPGIVENGMGRGREADGFERDGVRGDAQQAHAPERGERGSRHWSSATRRAR